MWKNKVTDPRLVALLEELKTAAPRNERAAARGRARFLSEAVSAREQQRHSLWTIFQRKEQYAMNIIVSTLVIVGLLFGGGATVAAAQNDLPNQPLYQVKLMSENAQLWFVSDPVRQIDMLMEQAQTRIQEMETLAAEGVVPPADGMARAQERIQRALQIAAQLDEASQLAMLQQIQIRLQKQEQQMLQLEQGTCTECVPVVRQTREMLQLQLREAQNGLAAPDSLQNQNQNQTQTQNQNQLQINQTPQAPETVISPCGTCTPALDGTGQQNGSGSPASATPVQQQNQIQQTNQVGGGTQNGSGTGGGGSPAGSGGGSSTGTGGQGGKP